MVQDFTVNTTDLTLLVEVGPQIWGQQFVSRGFVKEGTTPKKLMAYRAHQDVQGLKIPHQYETFTWDGSKPGKAVTQVDLSQAAFKPETPDSYFKVPEGASIQQQM